MPEQSAGEKSESDFSLFEIDPDFRGHSRVLTKKIAWRRSEPVWSERQEEVSDCMQRVAVFVEI